MVFDEVYRRHYAKREGLLWGKKPSSAVLTLSAILEKQHPQGARILDIGCGEGRNAIFLCGQGHDVHGIDASSAALLKARSLALEKKLMHRLHLVRGNLESQLPYPPGYFDAAFDIFSMTFVSESERRRLIDEVSRVLASGAPYLLEFQEHTRRQSKTQLLRILDACRESGFKIVRYGFLVQDWRKISGGRHMAIRILCRKPTSP